MRGVSRVKPRDAVTGPKYFGALSSVDEQEEVELESAQGDMPAIEPSSSEASLPDLIAVAAEDGVSLGENDSPRRPTPVQCKEETRSAAARVSVACPSDAHCPRVNCETSGLRTLLADRETTRTYT